MNSSSAAPNLSAPSRLCGNIFQTLLLYNQQQDQQVDTIMAHSKKSVAELRVVCKEIGLVSSGDKGTILFRLKLYDQCVKEKLVCGDNQNPCLMKFPALKTAGARMGVSPIGHQDEVLTGVVEYLSSHRSEGAAVAETISSDTAAGSSSSSSDSRPNGVALSKRILELEEVEDDVGILNLLGPAKSEVINAHSSVGAMRKNYLKISLLVHPDKIGKFFAHATRAFQALVKAFESLSTAEQLAQEDARDAKAGNRRAQDVAAISRSNMGCFRTRVCCPRCRQPWNEQAIEGNPEYFYNFLMMGLKRYSCSTCLCEFGCVTAVHHCPHCAKSFEYSPADYHRQLSCPSCAKLFGFTMYHASNRVMAELKSDLRAEIDRRNKARDAKLRRALRAEGNASRSTTVTTKPKGKVGKLKPELYKPAPTLTPEEHAFLLGLRDECPRCGQTLESYRDESGKKTDTSPQQVHLDVCVDSSAHARHRDKEAKEKAREEERARRQIAEDDAQALAAWSHLGGKGSDTWLLTDDQIKTQAVSMGLLLEDGGGDKSAKKDKDSIGVRRDLLQKIYTKTTGKLLLEGGDRVRGCVQRHSATDPVVTSTGSAMVVSKNQTVNKRKREQQAAALHQDLLEALPSNIHACSKDELLSFCAANGLSVPDHNKVVKSDLIKLINRTVYERPSADAAGGVIFLDSGSESGGDDDSEYGESSSESDIEFVSETSKHGSGRGGPKKDSKAKVQAAPTSKRPKQEKATAKSKPLLAPVTSATTSSNSNTTISTGRLVKKSITYSELSSDEEFA